MYKELAKQYEPQIVEDRTYKAWIDGGYLLEAFLSTN